MRNKYNIALLPKTKNTEIVNLTSLFQVKFGRYRLSSNSYAHVTILQLYLDDHEIDKVWDSLYKQLGNVNLKLSFEQLSYVTFNQEDFWVSLMPSNTDILYDLHNKVLSVFNHKQNKKYDPHMTLFNTKEKSCQSINKNIEVLTITDDFYLAIGKCDEVGQFTQIIQSRFIKPIDTN